MTLENFNWIVMFSMLMATSLSLVQVMANYVKKKPPGHQSLFDIVLIDFFFVWQSLTIVSCSLAILSRFDFISNLLSGSPEMATIGCLIYSFSSTNVCSFIFCLSILRIVSLTNLNDLEDNIGEKWVRAIIATINFTSGVSVCVAQVMVGEATTGTIYNVLTRGNVPVGPRKSIMNSLFYLLDFLSVAIMQLRVEWEKYILRRRLTQPGQLSIIHVPSSHLSSKRSSSHRWRTGLSAFVVSLAMGFLYFLNMIMRWLKMEPEYYLHELFFFNCTFFIVMPVIGIASNKVVLKSVLSRRRLGGKRIEEFLSRNKVGNV